MCLRKFISRKLRLSFSFFAFIVGEKTQQLTKTEEIKLHRLNNQNAQKPWFLRMRISYRKLNISDTFSEFCFDHYDVMNINTRYRLVLLPPLLLPSTELLLGLVSASGGSFRFSRNSSNLSMKLKRY